MSGAAESPGSKPGAGPAANDWGSAQGDVAALIRAGCSQGQRRGVRVVAPDKRGHIFFDQGHVVHAEFGEDVGLGAVIEMLHSGAVEFRPCARPWPSQPTLFFTAEKLLAATRPGAANLITGVRLKPGLLSEEAARQAHERSQRLEPPPAPAASPLPSARTGTPASGPALAAAVTELSRAVAAAAVGQHKSAPASPAARPATRTLRGPFVAPPAPAAAQTARAQTPSAEPPPSSRAGSATAREPLTPARTLPVAPVGDAVAPARSAARAPGSSPGVAPPSAPAAAPPSAPAAAPPSAPAAAPPASAPAASLAAASAAARTAPREESPQEPLPPPRPRLPVVWVQATPSPGGSAAPRPAPSHLVEADEDKPSTTMVRVSTRGTLLAARGAQSEQLANAAAFIHNQARLIAQDLGRHGRTAVHLRGGELSLLVVKSEVNDIAAALGPSERLRSLLRKAGLG